jgi:putative ABC transport system permease protein
MTSAALLSIALGITAATAVFSVVDAALFRQPPMERPDRLMIAFITRRMPGGPVERQRWSWNRFRVLQHASHSFERMGAFSAAVLAFTGGDPEPVNAEVVSAAYLPTLRVQPIIGTAFVADDDAASTARPVALLGHALWRRRFGRDTTIIGRAITVNGVTLTVLGVLPAGFAGLTGRAELWIPSTMAPRVSYAEYLTTDQNFISVVARLRAGVDAGVARTDMALVGAEIQRSAPTPSSNPAALYSATVQSLNQARVDPGTRRPMLVLLAGAACLLLLACANVAGLLLGRAVSRRREIAIRVATGATRARIIRQLLIESSMLAAAGGVLGVLAALPVTMRAGLPSSLTRGRNFYGALGEFSTPRVDVRVLLFSVALCAITTLLFGLVPALQASRVELTPALRDGEAGAGLLRGRTRLRELIVAVETALAVLLLTIAAMLATGWHRLATADAGFDRRHLLTFLIRPSEVRYPVSKAPALIEKVLAEIGRLPDVDAVSVDGCAPMSTGCANSTLFIQGRVDQQADRAPAVLRHYVGPAHFQALGVPIIRGRSFTATDRAGAPHVAIINAAAAQRFWPNEDPIGQRVWFGGGSTFDSPDSGARIIGVVGNVAYQPFDDHPVQADFYTSYAQFTYATRMVLVRTRGEPTAAIPAIRRAVRAADPDLALFDLRDMDDRAGDAWARVSYQTRILAAFAAAALVLAAMGIFAIIAHAVGERRREIGIRLALGASIGQVLSTVGIQGARSALTGVLAGATLALGAARLMASAVYGVRGAEPTIVAGVAFLVAAVSAVAAYVAARRALAVDPATALRLG